MIGRAWSRLKEELRIFRAALEPVPALTFVVAAACLTAYWYYGRGGFFRRELHPVLQGIVPRDPLALMRCLYWCVTAWVIYVAVPQATTLFVRRRWPDAAPATVGWRLGDWKLGLSACALFYAVMLPILAAIVWNGQFQGKYPMCQAATLSIGYFVIYEIALIGYFVAWEFFFRGWLTLTLEKRFGAQAVFIQMLPFVVAHFDKPDLESISSIAGGIALGWLAIRTRSFWYGAFIHAAVDVTLDVMMVTVKGSLP